MPQFRHNPETGQAFIFDQGQWRPATDVEVNIQRSGIGGQAAAAFEGATGAFGLLIPELGQALQTVNPVTSQLGLAGTLGGGALLSGGARQLLKRLPGRTAGGSVAERVALKTEQGFVRNPEQLLPEAAQGAGRIVRAGAETLPVTRLVIDFLIKNPNQRNLNRLAARALGATDQEFAAAGGKLTDDLLARIDARMAEEFDEVGRRISATVDGDEVLKLGLELNQEGRITNAALGQMADDTANQGRALMDMRSSLLAQSRAERDIATKNLIQNRIDEIDEIVQKALGDDQVTTKLYNDVRAKWRTSLALEKGQALGKTGDVNPASLDTALRSVFGRGFRRGTAGKGQPQAIQDFLLGAREAQQVAVGVPTSGTAERLLAAGLIGGGAGSLLGP